MSIENRNGEVSVTLPDEAGFTVRADTTDADIQNDFGLPILNQDNRKSLTGTVGKGSATVRIVTTQEGISVKRANIQALPPLPPLTPAITAIPPEAIQAMKEAKHTTDNAIREARKAADEARKAAKDADDR